MTGPMKSTVLLMTLLLLAKTAPGGDGIKGLRWRSDERLKINFLWVLLYITTAPQDHLSKVWFDNIVVAKDYVGPATGTPN